MALTAARQTDWKGVNEIETVLLKASTVIYKGGLVMFDTDGLLNPCSPLLGSRFKGVAMENVTSNASVLSYCRVAQDGRHLLDIDSADQTNVGDIVYAVDDGSVVFYDTDFPDSQKVGVVTEIYSSTKVWVDISDGVKIPEQIPEPE